MKINRFFSFSFLNAIFICCIIICCKNNNEKIYTGLYCVDVSYFNPRTGTSSSYTLTANFENNKLIRINFPSGSLDNSHFKHSIVSNGYIEFSTDRGYNYSVKIIEKGDNCLSRVSKAVQCNGLVKSGGRCKKLTDNKNGLCWQHQNQENYLT